MDRMKNKTWSIIGGSGSLGRALTQYILDHLSPKKIIIFSRGEVKQARMRADFPDPRLRFIIGDVADLAGLTSALRGVDFAILAAALKRVEVCEYNVSQAIRTNVKGAENMRDAAITAGVERVVYTSTDKACAALNSYGATKFLAERIIINANQYAGADGPRFSCTRYGNVSGSRGSVIPIWREALEAGNPISLTEPGMTRFWMTLYESVRLVMYALEEMHGGEIFIPALPAYDLQSLADAMAPTMRQNLIDVRPGEKMHETLVSKDESFCGWEDHNSIIRLLPDWYQGHKDGWKHLPPGYRLASDNVKRLTVREIKKRLKKI